MVEWKTLPCIWGQCYGAYLINCIYRASSTKWVPLRRVQKFTWCDSVVLKMNIQNMLGVEHRSKKAFTWNGKSPNEINWYLKHYQCHQPCNYNGCSIGLLNQQWLFHINIHFKDNLDVLGIIGIQCDYTEQYFHFFFSLRWVVQGWPKLFRAACTFRPSISSRYTSSHPPINSHSK